MLRRWTLLILGAIVGSLILGGNAEAFWGVRNSTQRAARFMNYPPGSQMVPYKVDVPAPGSQPVPTFDYGYFGARNRSSLVNHREYYGEVRQSILPAGL